MHQDNKSAGVFEMELAGAQLSLLAYVAKLLGGLQDAHDVLQNVNLTLCKQRDRYDASRPFQAWARTIAYYEVMTWRKRQVRSRLVFSDETVERLAESLSEASESVDQKLSLLDACKKKLPVLMRDLLESYYDREERLSVIAGRLKRTEGSLANSLYYIRKLLKECVEARLARSERLYE